MEKGQAGLVCGQGRIDRLFFKIFIPTLLGMIFNALITIVDGVFVGEKRDRRCAGD